MSRTTKTDDRNERSGMLPPLLWTEVMTAVDHVAKDPQRRTTARAELTELRRRASSMSEQSLMLTIATIIAFAAEPEGASGSQGAVGMS